MQARIRWRSVLCQERVFSYDHEEFTCYPGISDNELGVDGLCCVLGSQLPCLVCFQADFKGFGLESLRRIILASFILLTEKCPDELPGPLVKIVEGVRRCWGRRARRSTGSFIVATRGKVDQIW